MSELPQEPDFETFERRARLEYNFHLLGEDQLSATLDELEQSVNAFRDCLVSLDERADEPLTCADLANSLRAFARMTGLREQMQRQLEHSILDESLARTKRDLAKLQLMARLLPEEELLQSLHELDPEVRAFVDSYRRRNSPD
ncbi:MAG: hypothetical protein AB7S38_33750 [Vulcanimicrobiota bacterium]